MKKDFPPHEKTGRHFIFTPLAERLLAKMEWTPPVNTEQEHEQEKEVRLRMLPDLKFVVRRTTNPTKFTADDFR